jgi:hypothetical protein
MWMLCDPRLRVTSDYPPPDCPPPRAVDGLIDVLLDATRHHDQALAGKRLCAWQAALFPTGRSGLHPIRVGELRGDEPMQVVVIPHF